MSQHTSLHENLGESTNTLPTIATEMAVMRTISENENMQTLQVSNKRKFNRSLTEVRPDAYIFDDGTHFEVVPVVEECEEIAKSRETLYDNVVSRKISTHSEDSDSNYPPPSSQRPSTCDTIKRTPYLNIRQDTGNSTESKDTLTPLGPSDDQGDVTGDSPENFMELTFENAKQRAIKQRMCRRNSESGGAADQPSRLLTYIT
uniref:Uncharacterized protein n=1 Tax=Megaselia scalaris TaxID=36166 RepID=T1GMY4_MEGSC